MCRQVYVAAAPRAQAHHGKVSLARLRAVRSSPDLCRLAVVVPKIAWPPVYLQRLASLCSVSGVQRLAVS